MDVCDQCGFDYESSDQGSARKLVLGGSFVIGAMVGAAGARARQRPSPETWSPLEYGCHVRDVLLAQRERALLALVEESPSFAPIYRDERSVNARYSEQGPHDAATQLQTAADLLLWVFDGLSGDQLARPCIYNYPDPATRDVAWLLTHTAHEVVHHEGDIRRGIGEVTA